MSLKEFLERNRTIDDRLDRVIFSGSLIGQASEEHLKSSRSIESVKKRCETFFESVPNFGRWCELQNKEKWEAELADLYKEQNP